jgi:hypothetical protein
MKETGRVIERNRVLLRPVTGVVEKEHELKRISPHDLFQQEPPPQQQGRRWTALVQQELPQREMETGPEPNMTTRSPASPRPAELTLPSVMSDEEPGPSRSPPKIPTAKQKPKAPKKTKEYIPVAATTSGRSVKKPDVLDL